MSDIAEFTVLPPLRCFMPLGSADRMWCGQPASWMHFDESPWRMAFFCERHRQPSDVPIAGELVLPRVRLVCEVLFAGVTFVDHTACREALSRLEAAVEGAGGLLNLHAGSSQVGRWRPALQRGVGRGSRPHP